MRLRIDNRYRLSCSVLYLWLTADGYLQNTRGEAHNISAHGIFVLTDLCPPLGTQVELKVLLPRLDGTGVGMRLQGKGKVLRVVQSSTNDPNGFAASVKFLPTRPTTPLSEEKELGHMQC
jgi:hypothetical protein